MMRSIINYLKECAGSEDIASLLVNSDGKIIVGWGITGQKSFTIDEFEKEFKVDVWEMLVAIGGLHYRLVTVDKMSKVTYKSIHEVLLDRWEPICEGHFKRKAR